MIDATKTSGTASQMRHLKSPSFKDFFVQQALRGEPAIITGEVHRNVTGRLQDVDDNLSSLAPIVQCSRVGESGSDVVRASLPKDCPSIIRPNATVPKFALNDYIMRLSEDAAPSVIDLKRFPEAIVATNGASQDLHNCPYNSHMLLCLLHVRTASAKVHTL
jgi:hypothetical protein